VRRTPPEIFSIAAATLALILSGCSTGVSLDEPIEGHVWRATALGDHALDPATPSQAVPTVSFDAATGRFNGSGGCNRMSGSYTRSVGKILLSQLAATRMACAEPGRSATESQFFAALQTTAGYRLTGPGQLTLIDATGRVLGTFASATAR
jgi:heat shock protein HslJ